MTGTRWDLIAGLLLVAVGCSPSGTVIDTPGSVGSSSTSGAPVSTSVVGTTATPTTPAATTPSTLAGRNVDDGPSEGVSLAVIGVEHDDVLNVRSGPGPDEPIVATAEPTSAGLIALGRTRALPDGALWTEVRVRQMDGWVHLGFVAALAGTDDVTSAVVASLGEYPTSPSMREMGRLVATVFASSEPASRIVMVAPAAAGEIQDVTVDVVGVGDDSIRGYRVHVFAVAVSDGLSFYSAELTTLCTRGVTAAGLCA